MTLQDLRAERERQEWRLTEIKAEQLDVQNVLAYLDAQIAAEERAAKASQDAENARAARRPKQEG